MDPDATHNQLIDLRYTIGTLLFVGVFGFLLLLLPGMDSVAVLLSASAMGLLCAGDKYYSESDRQRIQHCLAAAFQLLFLVVVAVFILMDLSNWLNMATGVANFLNLHWAALLALAMSFLAGCTALSSAPGKNEVPEVSHWDG